MLDVEMALQMGREAAAGRMRGTCVIRRPLPDQVVEDEETGKTTPAYASPDPYTGSCYTRYPGLAYEQNLRAGGFVVAQSRVVVRIVHGPVIRPGDLVEILTDPDNPQLVGTVLRVASIDDMSQATAQRLLCEDNQTGVSAMGGEPGG